MNDKSINSLISAYHDGELTAAERAEVEQLLASSPEAKAELEAYRRMSNLLRDGRPALQSDLTPLVMQTIEQQMLLPKTSTRSRDQSQWTKWVAMAVVAAGLIIAVRLGWQAPPQAPGVANLPNQNKLPPNDDANRVVPKPQDHNQNDNAIAANPTIPEVKPAEIQLTASDLPLEVIKNLKGANPGKIVRFLKQSGKDVAIFHLMVLDTKPGLESLQMILSAQQIAGPQGQVGQVGVMAVYVEANQDQMDKVIAELQSKDQEQFIALAVQPPMKAEAVQKVVKNQSTDVASQLPLKQGELATLGVSPVRSEQLVDRPRNRSNQLPSKDFAVKPDGTPDVSPMRKVLIVLEKVPESLLPKPAGPRN